MHRENTYQVMGARVTGLDANGSVNELFTTSERGLDLIKDTFS